MARFLKTRLIINFPGVSLTNIDSTVKDSQSQIKRLASVKIIAYKHCTVLELKRGPMLLGKLNPL